MVSVPLTDFQTDSSLLTLISKDLWLRDQGIITLQLRRKSVLVDLGKNSHLSRETNNNFRRETECFLVDLGKKKPRRSDHLIDSHHLFHCLLMLEFQTLSIAAGYIRIYRKQVCTWEKFEFCQNMSIFKVGQSDCTVEGREKFAKTSHGPVVMVNNHSMQEFSNNMWQL